mmetsp:Transcript_51938/g.110352  ORF Transcript_51938/g.110352 Transcript_51938/m.110352 type:complete len:276 (-) Transcript_51938:408-1235(-)
MFIAEGSNFILRNSRVGKHTDLLRDVIPGSARPELLQRLPQLAPHRVDSLRHAHALLDELVCPPLAREDLADDPRAVPWGIGVTRPDVHLELAEHPLRLLGAVCHDRQRPNPLTIQSEVFGEALDEGDPVPVLDEHSDGGGVLPGVARRKSLVGAIEEDEEVIFLDDIADFLPLVQGGIHASGVVSASMKKDAATLGHCTDIIDQVRKVQTASFVVIVSVLPDLQPSVSEDGNMVSPCGVGNINVLVTKLMQHLAKDTKTTSARQGLDTSDSILA